MRACVHGDNACRKQISGVVHVAMIERIVSWCTRDIFFWKFSRVEMSERKEGDEEREVREKEKS